MRLALATGSIVESIGALAGSHAQILSLVIGSLGIIAGMTVLVGFLTPIAGAITSIGNLAVAVSGLFDTGENAHDKVVAASYSFVISAAITLLGPGAFSLDARLFGRREIIIPESSRTRLP